MQASTQGAFVLFEKASQLLRPSGTSSGRGGSIGSSHRGAGSRRLTEESMFTPATPKPIRPCKIPFPKHDSSLKEGETIVCIFHWSNAAGCYGAGAADEGGYLRLSDHQGHPGTLCRIRIKAETAAITASPSPAERCWISTGKTGSPINNRWTFSWTRNNCSAM